MSIIEYDENMISTNDYNLSKNLIIESQNKGVLKDDEIIEV